MPLIALMCRACARVAQPAFQHLSERAVAPLGRRHPSSNHPGRIVPYMLLMPARKLRHPVTLVILMKTGDGLEHFSDWGRVTSDRCGAVQSIELIGRGHLKRHERISRKVRKARKEEQKKF
jgi:hypothetical protein